MYIIIFFFFPREKKLNLFNSFMAKAKMKKLESESNIYLRQVIDMNLSIDQWARIFTCTRHLQYRTLT